MCRIRSRMRGVVATVARRQAVVGGRITSGKKGTRGKGAGQEVATGRRADLAPLEGRQQSGGPSVRLVGPSPGT